MVVVIPGEGLLKKPIQLQQSDYVDQIDLTP